MLQFHTGKLCLSASGEFDTSTNQKAGCYLSHFKLIVVLVHLVSKARLESDNRPGHRPWRHQSANWELHSELALFSSYQHVCKNINNFFFSYLGPFWSFLQPICLATFSQVRSISCSAESDSRAVLTVHIDGAKQVTSINLKEQLNILEKVFICLPALSWMKDWCQFHVCVITWRYNQQPISSAFV